MAGRAYTVGLKPDRIYSDGTAGYSYHDSGRLWLDPKTNRLIEGDMTIGATGRTLKVTMILSHWNDPKLSVPSVPQG